MLPSSSSNRSFTYPSPPPSSSALKPPSSSLSQTSHSLPSSSGQSMVSVSYDPADIKLCISILQRPNPSPSASSYIQLAHYLHNSLSNHPSSDPVSIRLTSSAHTFLKQNIMKIRQSAGEKRSASNDGMIIESSPKRGRYDEVRSHSPAQLPSSASPVNSPRVSALDAFVNNLTSRPSLPPSFVSSLSRLFRHFRRPSPDDLHSARQRFIMATLNFPPVTLQAFAPRIIQSDTTKQKIVAFKSKSHPDYPELIIEVPDSYPSANLHYSLHPPHGGLIKEMDLIIENLMKSYILMVDLVNIYRQVIIKHSGHKEQTNHQQVIQQPVEQQAHHNNSQSRSSIPSSHYPSQSRQPVQKHNSRSSSQVVQSPVHLLPHSNSQPNLPTVQFQSASPFQTRHSSSSHSDSTYFIPDSPHNNQFDSSYPSYNQKF
jgi:hypothetical protein